MLKLTKTMIAVFTIAAMASIGCASDDDGDDDLLLLGVLFIADQNSGNCAQICQGSFDTSGNCTGADGTASYEVQINTVPKGGCSAAYTVEERKASFNSLLDRIKGTYSNVGSNCDQAATDLENNRTTYLNSITQAHEPATFKTSVVGSLIEETRAAIKAGVATQSNVTITGVDTDAKVDALTLGSFDDYVASGARSLAGGYSACQADIENKYPNVAKSRTSPPTALIGSSCTYGSAATNKNCTSISEEF